MRGHGFLAQALAEIARGAFSHAPGVDENEGGAMRRDQLGEAVVDRLPDFAGHHRLQRMRWQFDAEVALAHVA